MKFTKMHGLGNDFIIIDSRKEPLEGIDLSQLAVRLCDRHYGIGSDGILIASPSNSADIKMRIFNPDGSEAEMCGNGIRCFAKYIYETLEKKKELISVETLAGIMLPSILEYKGKTAVVEVDMGIPGNIKNEELKADNSIYKVALVSFGNPHCVIFVDDVSKVQIDDIGPKIETHKMFPNRTNVEFVQVISRKEVMVKVWERGAGETLACGTGACASAVAGISAGKLEKDVIVRLPGGILDIEWQDDKHVILRGPAETVFEGDIK
ncbi:MAG: diaminopimelate epimerase [bacterium]